MKKWTGWLVVLGVLLLVGCGQNDSGGTKTNKAKSSNASAELKVKKGEYAVLPKVSEEGQDTLVLNVQVKNKGKKKIYTTSENFSLYEKGKDEKIKAENVYSSELDLSPFDYGTLSAGKSMSGDVIFNIDPKKEYELSFSTMTSDGEDQDVQVAIDKDKFKKSKSALNDAEKAGQAFIDVLFLGKDNVNYDKFVANQKGQTQEEISKIYKDVNEDGLFYNTDLNDEGYKTALDLFIKAQGKRSKITIETEEQVGDNAELAVDIDEGLKNDELSELFREYSKAYLESTDDYDSEKANQYAFSKFKDILNQVDLKSSRAELKLKLVKEDGKWKIDPKEEENEQTIKALLGNFY
ncbi:DUF5105 domain-containing protein [Listeria aquatica]|uniref:DUF5105 domain-containing protein n=1 Tax=Listeria aquatica TaxID=1494960 RepID=UPI0031F4B922